MSGSGPPLATRARWVRVAEHGGTCGRVERVADHASVPDAELAAWKSWEEIGLAGDGKKSPRVIYATTRRACIEAEFEQPESHGRVGRGWWWTLY